MKMRFLISTVFLCAFALMLACGCNGDDVARSGEGDENPPAETGTDGSGKTPPTESTDKDGWLVSTNADGAEFKIKVEKTGKESFRVHYVFTNKGTEAMNVLSYGIEYEMWITSSESDGTSSDKAEPKKLNLILGGAIFCKYEYPPNYGVLRVNKSLKGSIVVEFPLQAAPNRPFTGPNMGKDKDKLYEMAKGKDGLVCVLTYCYGYGFGPPSGDRPRGEKEGVKQIDSKPIVLKISESKDGATSSAEPTDKDGWLVSTNADNLELKVKAEKTGKESFKIDYVLTNRGQKFVCLIVPKKMPYYTLITPYDRVQVIKDVFVPATDDPESMELAIWFGIDPLSYLSTYYEVPPDWAYDSPLDSGKSVSGHVTIRFPVKKTGWVVAEEEKAEDQIYEMAKSETGVPCIVGFQYFKDEKHDVKDGKDDAVDIAGRWIQSKRMMLKIGVEDEE